MDRATAAPATVPAFFQAAFERLGDRPILEDRAGLVTIGTLLADAAAAAEGLARRGVAPGDRVGLWADNSRRWILADLAIQVAGAINVPRGTDTPEAEILELLAHADPSVVMVHDAKTAARFEKIRASLPRVREVVVLDPAGAPISEGNPGTTLDALIEAGRGGPSFAERAARVKPEDVATIIYTSGTTGRPKGVVLTQGNFAHQLDELPSALGIGDTDVFLSILPPWHIFERTVEYVALTRGARLVYTDLRRFRQDLAEKGPTFVPSVPRVWEAVHDAVKKALAEGGPGRRRAFAAGFAVAQARARLWDLARGHVVREKGFAPGEIVARGAAALGAALLWPLDLVARKVVFKRLKALTGGRLRGAVVGGGKMPPHVDLFFRSVGVGVLVGYGLTETSPVVTVRRERRNVLHTIGTAIARVEIEIRDRETGRRLGPGETGVVFTRGPHVMRGYHKDEALTKKAIDEAGWFDTGDLGLITPAGDLCFRGRQKETIVLAGGENVEPSRVEEALLPSPLVEQAVVVGQDRKTLAALVWPRAEVLRERLSAAKDAPVADLLRRPEALALVRAEVAARTGSGSGLRPFEVVSRVALLPEALSTENACLTATLKAKRHVIVERFAAQVEEAYR